MTTTDTIPSLTVAPISRETLALYAAASGDDNPIHLDPHVAVAAGLDDVIAHGMLSMAYLARVVTTWMPQHRLRSLRARFVAPTPIGAQPTCTGRIADVSDVDGERRARVVLTVRLSDGTTTVRGEAVIALE
ncbi:MaoC family dehydratase N-terminal domain-containing protein [Allokutzneria sp. A3M-2-11 16]|uniref:MaoC/PaaZ C-terminal domain-containing protein n=1 Tax=Allokutzneria sp. A3M-2-11 16 TaxID=2962043 RepID=UPI0020B7F476|nr:MaoC/PaaZ C-terminal domain-containing protein [Allokutzneria sp. A3M-2-11 16]MCP3805299.1 MaoC family dehydratase N-terminal domain-containing protein [Allokutzneria sp. A3M-2-11 16]